MRNCENLKTVSMESVGMNTLGTLRYVSFCDEFILWDFVRNLNVRGSNWGDVSGLFAGELPSLKKLNMSRCKNLKTDSMESIGMKALGTLHHVSFSDEFFFHDVMRGSKC